MSMFIFYLTGLAVAVSARSAVFHSRDFQVGGLVNTTSGVVQGKASELRPNVSSYLGIPYAQPPLGNLRFDAPQPYTPTAAVINATHDCACNRIPDDESALAGPAGSKILLALAQAGDTLSEDCLTVNVWTKPQSGEAKKAVLFWIFGGGFNIGDSANPVYDGSVLADENDVVVVSINYRLNIFGFSGAPGTPTNVGLRDQRLALEWARDNVAQFGGDPQRITVFGQSAGGASTDFMTYEYKDDPIANAFIAHSGVANSVISTSVAPSLVSPKWNSVSKVLGCNNSDSEAVLACVRSRNTSELLQVVGSQFLSNPLFTGFLPISDNETAPSDPQSAGSAGEFASVPYMTGTTDSEASLFIIVGLAFTHITAAQENLIPFTILKPVLDLFTLMAFDCPAADAAKWRQQHGVPVWRYRFYGGNYSNIYVNHVGTSYHTSDLPVVFGTSSSVSGMPDSEIEAQASAYMRKAWTDFAKDPYHGLNNSGWPEYNPNTASVIQLSYQNQTNATFVSPSSTDGLCSIISPLLNLASDLIRFIGNIGNLVTGQPVDSQDQQLWNAIQQIAQRNISEHDAILDVIQALKDITGKDK